MFRPFVLAASAIFFGQAATDSLLRYPLPDALISAGGKPVTDAKTWRKKRRPEILDLFSGEVYGRTPRLFTGVHFKTNSVDRQALSGTAVRKQVTVYFSEDEHGPQMHLLLYLPSGANKRVPVIVGLNFFGNETVNADPGIDLPEIWVKDSAEAKPTYGGELLKHHKALAPESARGVQAQQWQVEKILAHGFALATAYCGDIEPDFNGGMAFGVRKLFVKTGETQPGEDEWGALGAWAWGLSRAVDYLRTDKDIDAKKIAIFGFSRLGKAALWSAAQDTRFALVLSNESGVGGASLYRAATSESIEHLNTAFPYWFCVNFHDYTGHPDKLPVDGNLLLSLIAPRPLYVASAEEDRFSDPPAEFLSAVKASKVYELLGHGGLGAHQMPPINHPLLDGMVAYHVRDGKHDVTAYDWDQYLAFAERHFLKK
jgi:hypothetical protein